MLMQSTFLDFEAAFDSLRGRLLNVLRADGVPGKFVRLLDCMKQRTTAAVQTPTRCTTPFEVVTGVRQGAVSTADRLVPRVLRSSLGSSSKKPLGRKRKSWAEVVEEDLWTLGVGRQFRPLWGATAAQVETPYGRAPLQKTIKCTLSFRERCSAAGKRFCYGYNQSEVRIRPSAKETKPFGVDKLLPDLWGD
ncbi:hypothetical protein RB195_022288 [Necator americanus]|uniref:Reverse transcriptase domain-containing protein n=1 Tax=Necator americanus TaxID=51031 RepID=A0ABR1EEP0_NECAM